ncbi:MAG: HAD family hydrolase, partial [Tepidisphaeraceae bacterium]
MVRAVLFDLGDTLLDFKDLNNGLLAKQGAEAGWEHLRASGCPVPSLKKYRSANFASLRWALIRSRFHYREVDALGIMRRHAVRWGAPDNDAFIYDLAWHWYLPVIPHGSIEPDLIATLQRIKSEGIKIGVVSNTFIPGRLLDRHLEMMGLLEHLPVRIYSSDIGYRKPHPVIFYRALAAILTKPRETLFVGDVVKNDILGAGRLGMKTALKLRNGNGQVDSPADHTIRRISDLLPILFP